LKLLLFAYTNYLEYNIIAYVDIIACVINRESVIDVILAK